VHLAVGSRDTARAWVLVAAQFGLLAALFLWHPAPAWTVPGWVDRIGSVLGVLGVVWLIGGAVSLGRSLTALPVPVEHGVLKTGGLYRLSRHPIYTGVLALAASAAMRAGAVAPIVLALVLLAVLSVKARFEERILAATYPGYAAYAARTPRFVPGPWRRLR
jgi:protein-S-isoprenylcysteine O-methyltransferase Ste14